MNLSEEKLKEIESRSEAEITLSVPYNIFAEYCLDLTDEVRRLNGDVQFARNKAEQAWDEIDCLEQENQRLKERLQQLHRNYNTRVEKCHYLKQENKRLNEVNEALLEMDENKHEIIEHYKQTLEEIAYKVVPIGGSAAVAPDGQELQNIAQKALKGETNEY
jgi:chromosome segregation ATPase